MSFISFRSNNFPTHFLRHQGFRAKITELGSALDYDDASWRIVDGLDRSLGGGLAGVVSLESKNFPGHFLRHRSYELWADKFDGSDLNAKDASFRMVVGLADPTGFSFEAVNFPGHFLRHSSYLLRLDKYDGTPLFAKDATFHLTAAGGSAAPAALGSGVSLRSVNFPSHFLRHQDYRCKLTERHSALDHEDSKWFLVDGRDTSSGGMRNGYVSLQSGNFPKRFLRHRSYEGWLDENDGSPLFAKDSTFKVVPGLANPRAVSFEAVNFPGHFLRHSSFLMRLDRNDGSPLFAADASFFLDDPSGTAVPAHYYGAPLFINLTSHNFPHMALRHQDYRAKITELRSELDHNDAAFHIVDGLDGASGGRVAGAISFESKNFPGHFLRHRSFEVWLDKFDGSDLFRKDATFYVRRGLADPSGVSFEAVNFPGHFVRHSSYLLRLDKHDGSPLFAADATFKITDPASRSVIPITGVVGTGFGVAPVRYGGGAGAGAW